MEASLMKDYPNTVKEKLTSIIKKMSASPALFIKNPARDFTRKRKLPFETVIQLLLSMGGNTIYKELLEAQGYDINTATTSAFVQQRNKILPSAFEFLFHEFTQSFSAIKKYEGFRLLAVDGSDLHIATDPSNSDTYFQNNTDTKGFNLLHLNAMYDLGNRLYVDCCIQSRRYANENRALTGMVDRSRIRDNVILVADRGYESYNNFAHIEKKGWNYVIRVKDSSSSGILSGLSLPATGEFDVTIRRILTRRQTKEIKAHPEIYRFLPAVSNFDFLDRRSKGTYPISFRIVRLKISDGLYETLITNLEQSAFSPEALRDIYKMRWGIETSFRELKYAVGLTNFHAKKVDCIIQEIFSRMIMYNFSEIITLHVIISHSTGRYAYQVNFTVAIHVCKYFFRCSNSAQAPDVEALIQKNVLPIRPGRKGIRKNHCRKAVSFIYRVA
jgi:hypothetical protein